jgi:hypothetical protein
MKSSHGFALALATAVVFVLPCIAQEKPERKEQNKEDIWTEEEPTRGPRFDLTDEEIDRVMKGLKERDPKAAKELAKLRKEDPDQFKAQLGRVAREELGKIMRERFEAWRQKRQAEFLEWLGKNYRREATGLANLKGKDPGVYSKKLDLIEEKYRAIFEASSRNPELAEVLKEDLELKETRDELLGKLKAASDEKIKKEIAAQLEEVIARRFDLIVRRKEIAYERLLRRLEELRKQICESRDQIEEWRKPKFKEENVKKHLKDLTEGIAQFRWD